MSNSGKLDQILEDCRRRDRVAQRLLYEHFYKYAYTVSRAYVNSDLEAREVVNDAFLRVFTKIEHYDANLPFKPWFNRVVVNSAIDYYRKYQSRISEVNELPVNLPEGGFEATILDNLAIEDLLKLIKKLPPAYKMVLNLFAIEGFEHHEIAEKLGISEGTSKSNLFKARMRLREIILQNESKIQKK
jgi:RNA polymerase sigma factor (sigma-70 family)